MELYYYFFCGDKEIMINFIVMFLWVNMFIQCIMNSTIYLVESFTQSTLSVWSHHLRAHSCNPFCGSYETTSGSVASLQFRKQCLIEAQYFWVCMGKMNSATSTLTRYRCCQSISSSSIDLRFDNFGGVVLLATLESETLNLFKFVVRVYGVGMGTPFFFSLSSYPLAFHLWELWWQVFNRRSYDNCKYLKVVGISSINKGCPNVFYQKRLSEHGSPWLWGIFYEFSRSKFSG